MAFGTKTDLFNAANGKMPKRVFEETPPITPEEDGYSRALERKGLLGMAFPSLASDAQEYYTKNKQSYQPYVSAVNAPATRTFADVLARTGRTSSGSGKYGGFNNAGDLATAIGGAAMNLRDVTVPQLRSAANTYYGKLDKNYRQGIGQLVPFTTEYNPKVSSAGNFRIADQLSMPKYKDTRNAISGYMPTVNSWYEEQAKPAEEYLQTAQQLEMTPLSQLASSIATRGYGMDANLAAGKFSGLDAEYYKRNRDAQSMAQYGVPYDEYMAIQKEQEDALNTANDKAEADALFNIENVTGFSYGALSPIAGQTKLQMADTISKNYAFTNPADETQYDDTGENIIKLYRSFIANAQTEEAKKLIEEIDARPGAESLGLLLKALQNRLVTIPNKANENAIWGYDALTGP